MGRSSGGPPWVPSGSVVVAPGTTSLLLRGTRRALIDRAVARQDKGNDMHPTRDLDEAGGRPVIRPSSTATSEWPRSDSIQVADTRQAFVQARSKPLTVTLSQRTWNGLSLGAPFADRSLGEDMEPAVPVESGAHVTLKGNARELRIPAGSRIRAGSLET